MGQEGYLIINEDDTCLLMRMRKLDDMPSFKGRFEDVNELNLPEEDGKLDAERGFIFAIDESEGRCISEVNTGEMRRKWN